IQHVHRFLLGRGGGSRQEENLLRALPRRGSNSGWCLGAPGSNWSTGSRHQSTTTSMLPCSRKEFAPATRFSSGAVLRRGMNNWSVIATEGTGLGRLVYITAIALDTEGNLYVADRGNDGRIQKRDAHGNWSLIASSGDGPGLVYYPSALAVDPAGNLYAADGSRIQRRDARGTWSIIA